MPLTTRPGAPAAAGGEAEAAAASGAQPGGAQPGGAQLEGARTQRGGSRWSGSKRGQLLAMAALAFGLRLALFAAATGATGTGLPQYAAAADGFQYLAYARAWGGDMAELDANPLFRRLFPAYPAMIAGLTAIGVPVAVAALLPSWLAAAAVSILCVLCFGDRRVGWAMAALTPAYVFSGSLICTEVFCLLLSLAGIRLAERGRPLAAGLAFGLGGLFRPVAVFAMLGAAVREILRRRPRAAVELTAVAGAVVAAGLAAVRWRFGDSLMAVRAYAKAFGGEIFTWPFHSLVATPLAGGVPAWKLIYVAVHVAAVLAGCAWAVRAWRRAPTAGERGLAALAAVWLLGNTLNALCVTNVWGFHDFPRFVVPALPALFWVFRGLLPWRPAVWVAIGLVSLVLAFEPAKRRLESPPGAAPPSPAGRSAGPPRSGQSAAEAMRRTAPAAAPLDRSVRHG